jgi:WD40 repeat protein
VLPDGKLASGSWDQAVRVWDTTSGECLLTLVGHAERVRYLVVMPDGKLVSCSFDGTGRVWDAKSGECLFVLGGRRATALAVLNDGRLASGSFDGKVHVWEDGECALTLDTSFLSHVFVITALTNGTLAVVLQYSRVAVIFR